MVRTLEKKLCLALDRLLARERARRHADHDLPWFNIADHHRAGAYLGSLSNPNASDVAADDNRPNANQHVVFNDDPVRRTDPCFCSQRHVMKDCHVVTDLHLRVNDDPQRPVLQIYLPLQLGLVGQQTFKTYVVKELQKFGNWNKPPSVCLTTPIPDSSGFQHIFTIFYETLIRSPAFFPRENH